MSDDKVTDISTQRDKRVIREFLGIPDLKLKLTDEVLPSIGPAELEGDPVAWDANLNMRQWVQEAVEAKGAKFTGGGTCAEYSDIDIEINGMIFNIKITSR